MRGKNLHVGLDAHGLVLQRRHGDGYVQCKQRLSAARLLGDLVANLFVADSDPGRWRQRRRSKRQPASPVVIAKYRAAPVERCRWRHCVLELHAKCNFRRQRQLGDLARLHAVGQSSARACRIARHAPERTLDAREENEEHERQRRGQQKQAQGHGQSFAQRRMGAGELERHLRAQDGDDTGGGKERRGDGLGIKEIGQQHEEAEKDHDEQLAPRPHFQQFQRQQQHQHADAGLASEKGAVTLVNPEHEQQRQGQQQPARRHAIAAKGDPAPPEQQRAGRQRDPGRQVPGMRDHDQRAGADEQQGVGLVPRQAAR